MGYQILTKNGYDLFEVSSAFQKSIRRGLEKEALYWGTELDMSGNGEYAWKRMKIICSEDIGLAELNLPAQIRALYCNWLDAKKKTPSRGDKLFFIHGILLLVRAKKSRICDNASLLFYNTNRNKRLPIPDYALDKHTITGKRKGRSFEHFFTVGTKLENESTIPDPYEDKAKKLMLSLESSGNLPKPQKKESKSRQKKLNY